MQLRSHEGFVEGGMRLQIEGGRPTTLAEIAVNVNVMGTEDVKQFYFGADLPVGEVKADMMKEFGLKGDFTLYRVDLFEEPTYALRRMKVPLKQCHVFTGDLLILKSDKELLPDEKLKLSIHMTQTGFS